MKQGFGLYLHAPFCRRKCAYCDFNSYAGAETLVDDYVAAVSQQIGRTAAERVWPEVTSVFFGGGNPALLGVAHLCEWLKACRSLFTVAADAEITLEMNPEDAVFPLLSRVKDAGFNRLSLGWQSLNDRRLQMLGRGHDAAQAAASLANARAAGFKNVNVDLIFGLPGQAAGDWRADLAQTVELGPDHISAYALSVEAKTPLGVLVASGRLELPLEDEVARMYALTGRVLAAAGYRQYEISNYAREKADCRHNLNYWSGGDYLGFGAGAHSHLRGVRWWSVAKPGEFIERLVDGDAVGGRESLSRRQRLSERIFLGLRLNGGVDSRAVRAEFGIDIEDVFGDVLADLRAKRLIKAGRAPALTAKGRLLASEAMSAFV